MVFLQFPSAGPQATQKSFNLSSHASLSNPQGCSHRPSSVSLFQYLWLRLSAIFLRHGSEISQPATHVTFPCIYSSLSKPECRVQKGSAVCGNKYSMWSNQGRSKRDYELSYLGNFISIRTVIKLSILYNFKLPTLTAYPLSTTSPSGSLPWSALGPPLPHLVYTVD